jgi:hypothetical protein
MIRTIASGATSIYGARDIFDLIFNVGAGAVASFDILVSPKSFNPCGLSFFEPQGSHTSDSDNLRVKVPRGDTFLIGIFAISG